MRERSRERVGEGRDRQQKGGKERGRGGGGRERGMKRERKREWGRGKKGGKEREEIVVNIYIGTSLLCMSLTVIFFLAPSMSSMCCSCEIISD